MSVVDKSFDIGPLEYTYTEIHHIGSCVVRVQIRRDSYERQSWAYAHVLSAGREWTPLAQVPVAEWHGQTPQPARCRDLPLRLRQVADRLAERAHRILSTNTNPCADADSGSGSGSGSGAYV